MLQKQVLMLPFMRLEQVQGEKFRTPRDRTRLVLKEYGNYLYPHNYPGGWIENNVIFQKDLNVVRFSRHLQKRLGSVGELQLRALIVTRKSRILNYLSGSIKRGRSSGKNEEQ